MGMRNHWLKIDNAGKIFPAVSNNSRSSTFRLSFYLKEDVNPEVLENVVNRLLPRFDTFNVKIKSGLFWNYFAANNNVFKIEEETAIIGQYRIKTASQYCFRVLYFQKRITLETFHALCDGTGAMEFLKSIVYEYLLAIGKEIDNEGKIYSEKVSTPEEKVDAFTYNYDKKNKLELKEETAYKLKGDYYPNNWNMFIKASVDTNQFLDICHKKDVTATQFMTALLLYSIYISQPQCFHSKKPIKIFVPVNLRRFFELNTLRNFSLYIKVTIPTNGRKLTFQEILDETKRQFDLQLNKEILAKRISANVFFEKNIAIRLLPLFIKNIAFKIAYHFLGDRISTSYVSNIGKVNLPTQMYDYVTDADFVNAGEHLYLTMITLQKKMNFIFSSRMVDKSIIYQVIKALQDENLDVTIQSNCEDETL